MPNYLRWDYTKGEGTFYPIPESKYYVIATDFFNTGFGYAYKRNNIIVINCDSMEEGELIKRYIKTIPTLTNVTIVNKLTEIDNILYTLMNSWKVNVGL